MNRVGIIYHPKIDAARNLAEQLFQFLSSLKVITWTSSSFNREKISAEIQGTDLVLSVGGDGTILRVARAVVPLEVPILGVNLGHLGVMTELGAEDIMEKLPLIVNGEGRIERRTMLETTLLSMSGGNSKLEHTKPLYALNDVVVGRGATSRVVYIKTTIDDAVLTTYKSDGVIISTATGSTGYSLAAGGPILHPQAEDIMIRPISAHLTVAYALVLPPDTIIEMEVHTDHQAMLSIDGQVEFELCDGDKIRTKRSAYMACFLRIHPPSFFYGTLEKRLRGRN